MRNYFIVFIALIGVLSCKERPINARRYQDGVESLRPGQNALIVHRDSLQYFLRDLKKYDDYRSLFVDADVDCQALESIFTLKNLKLLLWHTNTCMEIPDNLGDMQALEKLVIETAVNAKELPQAILKLKNLKELELRSMNIKKIPAALSRLPNLETLALTETIVRSIDDSVATMPSLRKVYLPGVNVADTVKAHLLRLNPKLEVYIN